MNNFIDFKSNTILDVLDLLLFDNTTCQNITWATDSYKELGVEYSANAPIMPHQITGVNAEIVQPRVRKSRSRQQARTKSKAEVFTPTWICNEMNNLIDEQWFGRKNVFNTPKADGKSWTVTQGKIDFPQGKTWQQYVDLRRLEITCGEAPYLVSRYDTTTGQLIDIENRIGILDRKLRIVNENAADGEWLKWTTRAFESTYGYEYQGDNLLIARINLLMTFAEHYRHKYGYIPSVKEIKKIANIISWNIWQMDGLKGTVPFFAQRQNQYEQTDMLAGGGADTAPQVTPLECILYNWRSKRPFKYNSAKEQ